jgi:hypothetical protein
MYPTYYTPHKRNEWPTICTALSWLQHDWGRRLKIFIFFARDRVATPLLETAASRIYFYAHASVLAPGGARLVRQSFCPNLAWQVGPCRSTLALVLARKTCLAISTMAVSVSCRQLRLRLLNASLRHQFADGLLQLVDSRAHVVDCHMVTRIVLVDRADHMHARRHSSLHRATRKRGALRCACKLQRSALPQVNRRHLVRQHRLQRQRAICAGACEGACVLRWMMASDMSWNRCCCQEKWVRCG